MKIATACCLGLAVVSASAFAETPKNQLLYRHNGKLCTAADANKAPTASFEGFGDRTGPYSMPAQGFDNFSGCRTKLEWKIVDASVEQRKREWSNRSFPSTPASPDHEGNPPL